MQKKSKLSSFYNNLIFLLLGVGVFFRVYRINELLGFWYDQGRDALIVWDLIHKGKFFLIGPTTGLAGVFRGPWYYYLITPFYWLGRGDPVVPAVFLALSTILGIYIFYKISKKYFDDTVAFVFVLISSLSFYFLGSSRWLSNPTPMYLISAIYFWAMVKVIEGKKWGWYLVGLMCGFAMQFGSAAELFYLPAAAIFALLNRKYFPDIKTILISGLMTAFPFFPQLLFDARHGWIITKAVTGNFSNKDGSTVIIWKDFISQRLSLYYDIFASKIFEGKTVFAAPFLAVGILGLIVNWKKSFKNPVFNSLLILVLAPFFGLVFFRGNYGNLYDYYFTGYYFPIILLFSFLIGTIAPKFVKYLVIVVFAILFLNRNIPLSLNFINGGVDGGTTIFLGNQKNAIDYIYKDAAGRPFNVDEYVPPVIPYAYEYLFKWLGTYKYKVLPEEKHVSLLYTIEEVDTDHPDRIGAWYARQNGIGKEESKKVFGGITVERRTRFANRY